MGWERGGKRNEREREPATTRVEIRIESKKEEGSRGPQHPTNYEDLKYA